MVFCVCGAASHVLVPCSVLFVHTLLAGAWLCTIARLADC